MAANLNDKIRKTGAATTTTLSAPGKALGATSLTVGSTTNYPTDTGIIIAIRQVDTNDELIAGTYTEWKATVASGTSFAIDATPVYGNDQVYPAGSTTQVFIPLSSFAHNEQADAILAEHSQTGAHTVDTISEKTTGNGVTIDGLNIKDGALTTANSVGTAQLIDASITNAKLSTTAGELGGAWKDWTPTFANLSGGTLNYANYTQIGKSIFFKFKYTLAGAGVAGAVTMTLPVAENADYDQANITPIGTLNIRDVGATAFDGVMVWTSAGTVQLYAKGSAGSYVTNLTALSSTAPMTWTADDQIHGYGMYEAA